MPTSCLDGVQIFTELRRSVISPRFSHHVSKIAVEFQGKYAGRCNAASFFGADTKSISGTLGGTLGVQASSPSFSKPNQTLSLLTI